MKRREFMTLVAMAAFWPRFARAQQSLPKVGLLSATNIPEWAEEAIRLGLLENTFAEGRNLIVVRRSADGQFEHLPTLASELAESRVDVILAIFSPVPARAAMAVTTEIPIVFAYGGDPVLDGLVVSLNRPGANVTGATFIGTDLLAKRMEVMHEILPQAVNVGMLVNPKGTLANRQIADATTAAQKLGQRLYVVNASTVAEIDAAFADLSRMKLDCLIVSTDPLLGIAASNQLLGLTKRFRIPTIFNAPELARDGALVGYGPSRSDTWRQAAVYVGRILKGEKTSELPVVQPTKFQMTINLKTAKDLGIGISPLLLARADEVIE